MLLAAASGALTGVGTALADLIAILRAANRETRLVLKLATASGFGWMLLAAASSALTGVGTALASESAALAMLSITALPTSNMLSRLSGPSALTVSRRGFSARMILTLVG
jgi:hypothetical protein